MALEERLAAQLIFNPHFPGDPGPEVYWLFQGLERQKQLQVVSAVIDARIKTAEATAQAYKQIGSIMKAG